MKIAISTSSFAQFSDAPLRLLADKGLAWVLNPHGRVLTEEELVALLQDCVGLVAGTEPITAAVMDKTPGLRVISRCGVGMDAVDLKAATDRGIAVRNTPDGPTRAVAELTLAYALDMMRQVSRMDHELRAGQWKKRMGNLLQGKRLGIIGFGRIGHAVGELFVLMGCEVAFYDPAFTGNQVSAREQGRAAPLFVRKEKEELLAWADIVTLHCAKPKDGAPVLCAKAIAGMKEGAWLINAARGGIVDEEALAEALKQGRLAGAALDVFAREPYTGPLAALPQVVLTPHIGSYARESRIEMETDSVRNLLDCLDNDS